MSLDTGTKLGSFEITGLLGKGGMGEVYRARDGKLGREVAVKVLSSALTGQPEMMARFEREALSLAQLDHPNIGALHEFRDENGIRFLVMQLVEGETLAERISREPMSLAEVRHVFSQIAEGLEAAHEKGIVHRDLKPQNVKVTSDDRVKILDFGLARSLEGNAAPGAPLPTPRHSIGAAAPTLQMPATPSRARGGESTFIGTPQYMSPEQTRGKPVDRRADIWAFGVCLYEALTGARPFDGETITDVVTAILRDDPDWDLLPPDLPSNLHGLVRRCLERDPRLRLRDIGEAWVSLHRLEEQPSPAARPGAGPVTRFTISFPDRHHLSRTFLPFAIAHDGSALACSLVTEGTQQLHLRRMDRLELLPVPGTERGRMPFFSPDGEWLGFSQERSLRVVPVAGGAPRTVVECRSPAIGAVWTKDDVIVWGELASGLQRVNADGTQRQQLVTLDEDADEIWQTIFGDARQAGWILANTVYGKGGVQSRLEFVSTRTGERREIELKDANIAGRRTEAGHLVFARGRDLFATRTVGEPPRVAGRPIRVERGVALDGDRVPLFDLSGDGSLAYVPARSEKSIGKIYWVTRHGEREEIAVAPNDYDNPRFSPEGDSFAVVCEDRSGTRQIHLFDPFRGVLEKITAEDRGAHGPVWHPSGSSLVFTESGQDQKRSRMRSISLDTHRSVDLDDAAISQVPSDYSPDGRFLLFVRSFTPIDHRIFVRDGEGEDEALVEIQARNVCPRFHPSGNSIAYASNESGRWEVYVIPFHRPGRRIQVSLDGGSDPVWARDGSELFYRSGEKLMSASFESDEPLRVGRPEELFDFPFGSTVSLYTAGFDVHPDGERFVMIDRATGERGGTELVVVRNWGQELEELLP